MKENQINIRDPFILNENGTFYMYGTRAANFGYDVGGVDVYVSTDLENWSSPVECLNSVQYDKGDGVNWAPEVHKYKGAYYMFITFGKTEFGKGTHVLKSDSPLGPFVPHSSGALTPHDWCCLDGTLYVENGVPYIVFCHEHTQIVDGTICYARLSDDLKKRIEEPTTLFSASSCAWIDPYKTSGHYVTDGPFLYRSKTGELLMIWSSFIKNKYAELLVRFKDGKIGTEYTHLPPLLTDDSGHGMIFEDKDKLFLTYHYPNTKGGEHPHFTEITDKGNTLALK